MLYKDTSFSRCLFLIANSIVHLSLSNSHSTSLEVKRRQIGDI
nr:MAG TPA: hypothetical protein [Caudoviricetes sp.]